MSLVVQANQNIVRRDYSIWYDGSKLTSNVLINILSLANSLKEIPVYNSDTFMHMLSVSNLIVMPYCHNCGNELKDEDLFCPKCGTPQREPGEEMYVEKIDVDYPESDNPLLELYVALSRHLEISPGTGKLVEGTIEYDDSDLLPMVNKTKDTVTISQQDKYLTHRWSVPRNKWKLTLGTAKPYRIKVKTGVMQGELDLGGLPITDLNIETGVGENKVNFDEKNPVTMERMKIQTGMGDIRLNGLLNARFKDMRIDGGVGQLTLNFSGEPPTETVNLRIESGIGALVIEIPEDVPAIFKISGLTSIGTPSSIKALERRFGRGVYITPKYEETKPSMDFDISLGIGGITLRTI
jgi:hypothetical protein